MKSVENANAASPAPRLIPLTDWHQHHPWPPIGGLRHMMFNRKRLGFGNAFIKCGRRVLIDEAEFFQCVRNGGHAAS